MKLQQILQKLLVKTRRKEPALAWTNYRGIRTTWQISSVNNRQEQRHSQKRNFSSRTEFIEGNISKGHLGDWLTQFSMGSSSIALHSEDATSLVSAHSTRPKTSSVPVWHWRSVGFLERHWSSIHTKRLRNLDFDISERRHQWTQQFQ